MTLNDRSIVKCFDCYELKGKNEMWCVLEFMDGGTLSEARKNHKWIPGEIAFQARQLLKAIRYIHSKKIMHRDIKSANIMFTYSGEVKLIDFGLATDFPNPDQKLTGMIGSPFWMAPEMIRGLSHNHKVDIWSAGVCLFELVNGHIPFYTNDIKGPISANGVRAMFLVGTGHEIPFDNPGDWDVDSKDFFSQLLCHEPQKRPEAAVLLEHKFLQKAVTEKAIKKMLLGIFKAEALNMF